jgi:hypothetical protein
MLSDAILGRDLLSKPGFKIEFVNDKVNIINLNNNIIMKEVIDDFIKIYNNKYNIMLKENVESRDNNVNFDMKIILKHDQPITFRPRRLSYSE